MGTLLVIVISDPMVDVLSELGRRSGIPAFYVAFVLAPMVWLYMYVCLYMCLYVYYYMYILIYMFICVYVYMCVCGYYDMYLTPCI
jgi:hypothetical protein